MASTPGAYLVERTADIGAFLAAAGDFLGAHEAENNLILGLCSNMQAMPGLFPEPPLLVTVRSTESGAGEVVGAALQTAPHRLVLSWLDRPAVVDAMADALADVPLPGVLGIDWAAAHFGKRWTSRTGQRPEPGLAERIHRLSAVREVPPAEGTMRIAVAADARLIEDWLVAFSDEALGESFEDAAAAAQRWIAGVGRTLYLWDADGETVSMCGVGGRTPTGIRVGPVYTPPEHRARGYATNLVAQASKRQLDAGRRFVFLFTDAANATSNHIYALIGYEPVAEVTQVIFRD
jgi:uncharacterized protein